MHDDFAFEPIPGLPELPPEGERILWQGKPRWFSLARQAFKLPWIAAYFGLLALWGGASAIHDGVGLETAALGVVLPLLIGAVVVALLCAVGYWAQGTTIYTITSERVIIRYGLAFQMTINLPFRVIEEAQLLVRRDGTGNIPLILQKDERVSNIMLWPHVRPWHWRRAQPMLRAIAVPEAVARVLADALADHARRTGTEGEVPPETEAMAADTPPTPRLAGAET
ncbi:photosynthetic complex putative assembly protein PuhB [Roseospira marina]|uniref:photosynthetic complex putative assembly protein PuhB n=1 Tax=Roseospira marina TaxID=140057 RepID=UPI00147942E5|nr:photosynthetic complex putative assembly protein PuhB [Roseospira marina]MBB4315020.1 hypothetical protein [Roseospira marina]MBB5088020.1 hypothetical protein [Roseospira marina]